MIVCVFSHDGAGKVDCCSHVLLVLTIGLHYIKKMSTVKTSATEQLQ